MRPITKLKPWTVALAAAGVITLPSLMLAEEKLSPLETALSATTLSGFVDTSAIWKFGTGNGGNGVNNPQPGDTFPGRSYDGTGKQDGFNLNAIFLTLSKPLGRRVQFHDGVRPGCGELQPITFDQSTSLWRG
ncbi:MAG: hypothetical protein NTW03_01890 [Verrucomicrobia bacterium]|nr:hypothetical protein [Verrucomicrobiota bacterium]